MYSLHMRAHVCVDVCERVHAALSCILQSEHVRVCTRAAERILNCAFRYECVGVMASVGVAHMWEG